MKCQLPFLAMVSFIAMTTVSRHADAKQKAFPLARAGPGAGEASHIKGARKMGTMPSRPKPSALNAINPEVVSVTGNTRRTGLGGGFMTAQTGGHTERTIMQSAMSRLAASPNPLTFVATMPGANVTNAYPFGMAQGNLSVRGMNSDQIGMTLDGAPLNDAGTYMVFPNQYVDTENLQSISLRPGASDLDALVTGASGGITHRGPEPEVFRTLHFQ